MSHMGSPLILYPLPACGGTPPASGENADSVRLLILTALQTIKSHANLLNL